MAMAVLARSALEAPDVAVVDAASVSPRMPDAATEARAPSGQGRLEWLDGDRLTLRMENLDMAEGILTAHHGHIREPLSIAVSDLDRFEADGAFATSDGVFAWVAHLGNGDRLRGAVASLTDKTLEIDTWYDGRVNIDRAKVKLLEQSASDAVLYEGPTEGETGWIVSSGRPQFARNRLVMSHQTVTGRVLPRQPAKMRLDFTAEWMWHGHLQLMFYTDVPAQRHRSVQGYSLTIQGNNRIELHRSSPDRGMRRIGQATMTSIQTDGRQQQHTARFTLFADRENRRFRVYVNDQPTADWTDPEPFDTDGKSIVFSATQSHPLEVHSIRASEWDGYLPTEALNPDMKENNVALRLRNGDMLTGKLVSIRDGIAHMTTAFGTLDIPLDRLAQIAFPIEAAETEPDSGRVRMELADRSVLTLQGLRLADGSFAGVSENTGAIRIPLPGVRSMRWNLDRNRSGDSEPTPSSDAGNPDAFALDIHF